MKSLIAFTLFVSAVTIYLYAHKSDFRQATQATEATEAVARARTAVKLQECRDACDQPALVEGDSPSEQRRLRRAKRTTLPANEHANASANANANATPPASPEPIRSFTRAPADHAKAPHTGRITITGQPAKK